MKSILAEADYVEGQPIVVAVSGGPDSMALLHQLLQLPDATPLHVAHLDHALRDESAADANYVARLTKEWGLSFHSKRTDARALASEQKLSLEEAGRHARYDFLAEVAAEIDSGIVAVGHNADDQAETVLLHLLRGSGLAGLQGMRPVAPMPGAKHLKLIRPLLHQTRSEIEDYCQENNLRPLVDQSNQDPIFVRNRIRHSLMPQLSNYNPQIQSRLNQLAEIAAAENALLQDLVDEVWHDLLKESGPTWLIVDRRLWQSLPLAIKRRTMRHAILSLDPGISDLSFKTIEHALDVAGRESAGLETTLPGSMKLLADYDTLIFSAAEDELPIDLPQLTADQQLILPVPGSLELSNDWQITAQPVEVNLDFVSANPEPWVAYITVPETETLYVQTRRPGETMQPLGLDGHASSLQDIMVNRKMPSRLRDSWPLVATSEHVIWLVGHILDHRVRITKKSGPVIRLSCKKMDEEL